MSLEDTDAVREARVETQVWVFVLGRRLSETRDDGGQLRWGFQAQQAQVRDHEDHHAVPPQFREHRTADQLIAFERNASHQGPQGREGPPHGGATDQTQGYLRKVVSSAC